MLLLLCVVGIISWLLFRFYAPLRSLPPGPFPLPLVGNALSLFAAQRWEHVFLKWRQKYGDVYTYFIGPEAFVSITSHETMVELFVKDGDAAIERTTPVEFAKRVRGGLYGIIDTSGELWREQRRFALKTLRDFGLSKSKMEERVLDEMQTICERIDADIATGAEELDFNKHTDLATGSVINAIVCGYRFSTDGNEKQFYLLKETNYAIIRSQSDPLLLLALMSNGKLANLPIMSGRVQIMIDLFRVIINFVDNCVEEHIKNNDYTEDFEPRDFIDAYLIEMSKQAASGGPTFYTRQQLVNVCLDLWFAGQETTSTVITWGIAYVTAHSDVAAKLHEELDRVIGSDQAIGMSDRSKLPYVNATINEILRCANIIGQNIPRRTSREVTVGGYTLPKGTIVVPQISVLSCDPEIYDKPQVFDPSRFIDANGELKRADELLPFSIGKRACLGESLARMELFIFFANLFNRYKFASGAKPPTLEKAVNGVSMGTKAYTVKVEKRY